MSTIECFILAVFLVVVASIVIAPWLVIDQLKQIDQRIQFLQADVDDLFNLLDGDPDGPDEGEDEPAVSSNVIAIGRRVA